MIVLIREWGITVMRFWLIRRGVVMPAGRGGKLKTVVQTLALALLITPVRQLDGSWEQVGLVVWWIGLATMAVAVVLTVWTGVEYVRDTIRAQRRQDDQPVG